MDESRKIAIRETLYILIGVAVLTVVMFAVYLLLGRFNLPVLFGGIVGAILSVGNFFFMAVGASLAADRAEKQNVKGAIHISAITFGIGHIVNLLNGADLIPTLIQICYAISIGYLFVIMFHKSKSLIPCIVTHCLVNSLSIFNVENTLSLYIAPIFLTIIPLTYAIYINKNIIE